MAAPVLFFEPDSGYPQVVQDNVALETAKTFVQILVQTRKANPKISLNFPTSLGSCELAPGLTLGTVLGGGQYRDEWTLIKDLTTRSPLSSGFEDMLARADLTEVKAPCGQISTALLWASLLETGTISFHAKADWLTPWVNAERLSIDENGDGNIQRINIANASALQHVEEHKDLYKSLGIDPTPDSRQLWKDRGSIYQGLRFLPRVQAQIDSLATSGAPFEQALASLVLLNADAINWMNVGGAPSYSQKVADGEHDNRREQTKFFDDETSSHHYFERHAYFTGGIPGRIHFRLSNEERKFVIANVGFKF